MKANSLELSDRLVGYDYAPLVIADIGINHGGSLSTAKRIVDSAIEAGIEVIKHQTHIVEDEMTSQAKEIRPTHVGKSIFSLIEECALDEKDERALKDYVENKGALFLSTPFSRAAADRLEAWEVPAYKIGSGECNNYPLIEHICGFGKPIILSTGMNTLQSVAKAVTIIEHHKIPYALLHCTNVYPTPPHLVRLGAMVDLQNTFPNAVIGLSDHTTTNHACFGAIALGASILERHYTDTLDREGPDIQNSMDSQAAKELLEGAIILRQERGGSKGAVEEEQPVIDFAFASVVSITTIKPGEVFTRDNIWVKRPGTGPFYAEDYNRILGMKARRDIPSDKHLAPEDIENNHIV